MVIDMNKYCDWCGESGHEASDHDKDNGLLRWRWK